MPVYEYKCDSCETVCMLMRKIENKDNPVECVKCGGEARLVMSKPGHFRRGPAWHARMGASMPGEYD